MTLRDILAGIEPEAIPYPFSRLYAMLSSGRMFGDFYRIVAGQVVKSCSGPGARHRHRTEAADHRLPARPDAAGDMA
jgi:hypothetical protein